MDAEQTLEELFRIMNVEENASIIDRARELITIEWQWLNLRK